MSATGLMNVFNRCGEKAGIEKKVNPHSFRHDRATHLAATFTEQQLKMFLGWSPASIQPSIYVHLSGKNMDDAVLRMYGIKKDEYDTEFLKPGVCPRCRELTAVNANFCLKCGMPLKKEFENLKTNNKDLFYDVEVGVENFVKYDKLGKTFEERKQILMMCYIANVTLDELLNWTLDKVAYYISATDDYYDEDEYIFNECYRLIRECGQE
jgi:hypothetical protein